MTPGRVWVISELYYPEETSTGYLLTKIAEGLATRFQVSVLCSQPTYAARGQRAPEHEVRNRVEIHRCWGTTLNKNFLPLRFINMITITLSIFFNTLRRVRPEDCVLVVTNPPTLPFAVGLACRLRAAKPILIVHDVYPEVLVLTGIVPPNSFIASLIQRATRLLYRQMEWIIVLGRDMLALVKRKLSDAASRVVIVTNWADIELVHPASRVDNSLLRSLSLVSNFVIQYAGNIGRTHGIENLVACAEKLGANSKAHFLFIGSGAKRQWLDNAITTRALKNVTLLEQRPRSDQPNFLNACDVAIISFVPGMAGVSVPSRMYNIMAAGKPIIAVADEESELALVIEEENIGWVVPPEHPDMLVDVILNAQDSPALLADMGARARKAAESKYSQEQILQAYGDLVKQTLCADERT